MTTRVTVWSEFRQEHTDPPVAAVYPDGHARGHRRRPARGLGGSRCGPRRWTSRRRACPRTSSTATDVLTWWGHVAHDEVTDEVLERVHARVLGGMGLVVLHSGHFSRIFRRLMGTTCDLKWREDGRRERLWVVDPSHPIAEGLGESFVLPEEEMYGEHFDIPAPDELVLVSWFEGGEVFRSGCDLASRAGAGSSTCDPGTRRTRPTSTRTSGGSSPTRATGRPGPMATPRPTATVRTPPRTASSRDPLRARSWHTEATALVARRQAGDRRHPAVWLLFARDSAGFGPCRSPTTRSSSHGSGCRETGPGAASQRTTPRDSPLTGHLAPRILAGLSSHRRMRSPVPSLYIDGAWVASGDGTCSPVINPSDAHDRHRGRRRHRRAGPGRHRRGPPRVRHDRLAAHARPASGPPCSTRVAALLDRDQERLARAGDPEHRQGDAREPLGHRRRRARLPLLRRPRRQGRRTPRRHEHPDGVQPDRLRAGRRVRAHRAVELPAPPDELEDRPGARRRQHGRS